jgi:hypothetical protein
MASIPVKISILERGTRRLNIARNSNFSTFEDTVKELFGIQNRLDWVYIDEENDLVTFSTSQEFQDILSSWNEQNILRLNATPAPLPQRVEEPVHANVAPQQASGGCPFSRASSCVGSGCCSPSAGGCCGVSMPSRIAVILGLFYSIFTHPFLTFIGLLSVMFITRHHYPATYEKLTAHARTHWRKVALAYGLYMLFNCKVCTMLIAIPVGYFLVKKFQRCHQNQQNRTGECCYTKVRDAVKDFIARTNITIDGIEKAVHNMTRPHVPITPAPQPQEPQQPQQKLVEPSAPMYPSAHEIATEEVLPQRVESSSFQGQLEALENMGFSNRKLNEHLLRNFNGNLDRVVTSLIQLQSMQ